MIVTIDVKGLQQARIKPRSDAKMYQLPKAVLDGVNERLVNCNMSYADIISCYFFGNNKSCCPACIRVQQQQKSPSCKIHP